MERLKAQEVHIDKSSYKLCRFFLDNGNGLLFHMTQPTSRLYHYGAMNEKKLDLQRHVLQAHTTPVLNKLALIILSSLQMMENIYLLTIHTATKFAVHTRSAWYSIHNSSANMCWVWLQLYYQVDEHWLCNVFVSQHQSCNRASFWSLNTDRAQHLFLKPDLGPKPKFSERVTICATARYWWRSKVNRVNNSQSVV